MKTPDNTQENAVSAPVETSISTESIAPAAPTIPPVRRRNPTRPVLPRQWEIYREKGFKPFYHRLSAFPKDPYPGVARWIMLGETDENLRDNMVRTTNQYVIVDKVPQDIAKKYIRQNHYLRQIGAAEITYGLYVFKKPEYKLMWEGKIPYPETYNSFNVFPRLIGVAIYGNPVGASTWKSISNVITKHDQVKELKRMFVGDHFLHAMGNGETKLISNSIDLLKNEYKDVLAIVTYAAPDQHHKGSIYRGANFSFQPTAVPALTQFQAYSQKTKERYVGGWTQPKSLGDSGIRSDAKSLKKEFGYPVALKNISYKFRYIYIIARSIARRHRTKEKEAFKEGATKYPFSPVFPDENYVNGQFEFYSRLIVWYNENESVVYKSNLDPEKFLVHPINFENEKNEINVALPEINKRIEELNNIVIQKSQFEKRLKEINEHLDMIGT